MLWLFRDTISHILTEILKAVLKKLTSSIDMCPCMPVCFLRLQYQVYYFQLLTFARGAVCRSRILPPRSRWAAISKIVSSYEQSMRSADGDESDEEAIDQHKSSPTASPQPKRRVRPEIFSAVHLDLLDPISVDMLVQTG